MKTSKWSFFRKSYPRKIHMTMRKVVALFPKDSNGIRSVRKTYFMVDGHLVGTYQNFYRNGKVKTEKIFDDKGVLISKKSFRSDGTRISKVAKVESIPTAVTLTSVELEEAMTKYNKVRKEALNILQSRKINVSTRATDKSLLKQFKQFEENCFSF